MYVFNWPGNQIDVQYPPSSIASIKIIHKSYLPVLYPEPFELRTYTMFQQLSYMENPSVPSFLVCNLKILLNATLKCWFLLP